jgi:hypothetical protein
MNDTTSLHLYVSPVGKDTFSGLRETVSADGCDGPLATLAATRDAARRCRRADGPVTVHLAAGVYELADTLCFGPDDGGTAEAPVSYVAAAGAAPVISGGHRITDWRETTHNGQRCWIADIPEVKTGNWNFTRLYVNDAPRSRPRLPKSGFHRFTGLAGCSDSADAWNKGPDQANFAPGEIRRWHNWQDAELITYQLWFDSHHRFKEIDEAAGVAHFHTHSLGSLRDERGEFARYFVENVFEALDTPGEWYLDRRAGRLYYLPLPGEQMETTTVMAPRLTELVRLQGKDGRRVTHLRFENLQFAHQHWELPPDCPGYIQAAWGVPGAIILEGAEQCVFYGCTVAHVNGYGIEILAGSTENSIAACVVHDAGAGGIKIGHEENRPHEGAVGNELRVVGGCPAIATVVSDCTIRDCGHIFPSAIGIWIGNSGWNRIVHNHIFNCNYTGISCGWTWGYAPTRTVGNRIEYNHIHHINHREILSDNGGIYTLGVLPGTVLRGNLIHDISCYGYAGLGIYADEGSSEMRIEENLVCGTKESAFSTHYGRDNLVQNNIFALSRKYHLYEGKQEQHRTTVFRRNLVVSANGAICGGWDLPQYTACDNLFWSLDGSPFTFYGQPLANLQAQGQNLGSIVADPLFTDAAGGDFTLRPDSPARAIGFRPFDPRAAGSRLRAQKPCDFDAYVRKFPLPDTAVPIVRTAITLLTDPGMAEAGGPVEFKVTLTNVGKAAAQGVIRLIEGPKGMADRPSVRRIAYALEPGASQTEHVTVRVQRSAPFFWLDSEPSGTDAVPTRGLALAPSSRQWEVPRLADVKDPEQVAAALAKVPSRKFARWDRTLAEVRLAAGDTGLLMWTRFFETEMRPCLDQPWTGSSIELIALPPTANSPAGKRQVSIVPRVERNGADALILDPESGRCIAAPTIHVSARPMADGCELAAVIPWGLLGSEPPPAEFPFELMVNVFDRKMDRIIQQPAFEPLANGSPKIWGRLTIIEKPT